MRFWTFAIAAAVTLVGCQTIQPVRYLHKPGGVSVAEKQLAVDECRIASFREIPQTMATQVTPGYSTPGSLQCHTIGGTTNCYNIGGVNVPPTATTYDVNAELRDRYLDRCLQAKGFSISLIPVCGTQDQASSAKAAIARGEVPACAVGKPL